MHQGYFFFSDFSLFEKANRETTYRDFDSLFLSPYLPHRMYAMVHIYVILQGEHFDGVLLTKVSDFSKFVKSRDFWARIFAKVHGLLHVLLSKVPLLKSTWTFDKSTRTFAVLADTLFRAGEKQANRTVRVLVVLVCMVLWIWVYIIHDWPRKKEGAKSVSMRNRDNGMQR